MPSMKPLPLPLRIAAGLVATAVENARELPRRAVELPVTAVSQALQASMRMQQTITDLAIKGDRMLGSLRPVEEKPSWATFDEDLDQDTGNGATTPPRQRPQTPPDAGHHRRPVPTEGGYRRRPAPEHIPVARPPAPKAQEQVPAESDGPGVMPGYPKLTIPQLRARLRNLTVDDLQLLLAWEVAHEARAPYVTMLTNRIATVTAS